MKKDLVIITGAGGLIGSEAVIYFHHQGFDIIGIDNDKRAYFFGASASTSWRVNELEKKLPHYSHYSIDVSDLAALIPIFLQECARIKLIVHCAAQPSHDWAAKEPLTDFSINAMATLNLLELTRQYCPSAVFIFTSTNKVYGDRPNQLPLVENKNAMGGKPGAPLCYRGG